MYRRIYLDGRLIRRLKRKIRLPYPITFYWPTEYKVLTQAFGIHPEWYKPYGLPGHEGLDMRSLDGTEIYAVWWGTVSKVADYGAYGKQIRIKHTIRGKEYESIYAHFKKHLVGLVVGDRVKRGQLIGYADSTGNSTGSHLHLTLKQFSGEVPQTEYQLKFKDEWAKFNIIDPTLFFRELRDGYK